ncbi:MAG: hypothetical protein KDE50_01325 [Caldilineaceae bacterium]|nr:hypothetical protein [Nitrospira sp.]MCB0094352.1 hypothetical protein [Caldilineaceae bacterium]MCB0138525.1 hypothetical protein [Caldilineaceae bacterium]
MMSEQEWNALPDQGKVALIKQKDEAAHRYLLAMLVRMSWNGLRGELRTEEHVHKVSMSAYEAIWRKIEDFQFKSKFSTWCIRVVVNKVNDIVDSHYRKEGKNVPLTAALPEENWEFELQVPLKTICRRIWPCWQEVRAETRQRRDLKVWLEIDLKGKCPQEVADRWAIKRGYANTIATRIRQKLQKSLQKHGYANSQELVSL